MSLLTAHPPVPAATQTTSGRQYVPYLLFTIGAALYFLPFMRLLLRGTDEGTLVEGAVRIAHGQVFARDFFEVVGPGTFYWLALFFRLFGATFAASRADLFVTSLGTALLLYFLSRRLCGRYSILPCIIVFATYFGMYWPTISHHMDSNFFALLAVACLLLWQDTRKTSLLLAAGIFAAVTTFFLQPKGILLLLAFLTWLWIQNRRRVAPLSSLSAVIGGYAGAAAVVLLYFWSRRALGDLVYANVRWPFRHYAAVNAVHYAQGMIQHYWNDCVMRTGGFNWTFGVGAVLITPFLFIAALPALVLVLGFQHGIRAFTPEALLYWICGWALWLSEMHRKDIFHLVYGAPLLIVVCIYLLGELRAKVGDLALQVLSISAVCLASFNLFIVLTAHSVPTRVGPVALFSDDPVLTFLNNHVAPGEEFFAYPYSPMYYFLAAARNPTRYSILVYGYNTAAQFQQTVQTLERDKVKYVLWDTTFQAKAVESFPAQAHMRPGEFIMEPYLESHYNLVKDEHGVRLLERKRDDHAR